MTDSRLVASITTSVDGYYVGPDDGPGCGLGVGGERLHWWVFGGPWTYDAERGFDEVGEVDKAFMDDTLLTCGAVVCGRGTYEAAGAWGGKNPWPTPLFVVTHRVEDQPDPEAGFTFVADLATGIARAREAAAGKDVNLMGGGDVIRQAFQADLVDELLLSTSPVLLGRGKRLFDGWERDVDLEKVQVWDSPLATHVRYRVLR